MHKLETPAPSIQLVIDHAEKFAFSPSGQCLAYIENGIDLRKQIKLTAEQSAHGLSKIQFMHPGPNGDFTKKYTLLYPTPDYTHLTQVCNFYAGTS